MLVVLVIVLLLVIDSITIAITSKSKSMTEGRLATANSLRKSLPSRKRSGGGMADTYV